MFLRLFLLFTITTAVETFLLVQIGQIIGGIGTVALILATGALGSYIARREGVSVWTQLQQDLNQGIPPADRLIEGLLILIGGTLLITPGVLTDVLGFSLIFPVTRQALAPALRKAVTERMKLQQNGMGGFRVEFGSTMGGTGPRPRPQQTHHDDEHKDGGDPHFDHPVV